MWKLKESIPEHEKEDLKENVKSGFSGLIGKIPGLLEAVFIDKPISSSTHDMALITLFESEEALYGYKENPLHLRVANTFVRPNVYERSCMDYEEE